MRQVENVVEIGVERKGKYSGPEHVSEEIKAIDIVMGGVEEGLESLVTAARKACPNPNCCLSAEATPDEAGGGSWDPHPMNDTTYTVPFTRVEVSSRRLVDCAERADRLTSAVASMVKTCIDATGEADTAGKEKSDAAAKKAESAMSTAAVTRAKKTVETAEAKAKKIESDGEKDAKKAQNAVYTRTRKEVVASLRS